MVRIKLIALFFLMVLTSLFLGCTENPEQSGGGGSNDLEYDHERPPGASANDLLSDSSFSEMIVEIDYMPGQAPSPRAIDSLKAFLETRLNKSAITILEPTQVSSGGQNTYSASDIREIEQRNRGVYSEENLLATYILITDGYYTQSSVLGLAYNNTSTAYFGAAFADASAGFGGLSDYQVEAISFRHEFGHLFGLVNIEGSGTEMQTDHQDEQNGHHCDNDNCLMYYAMEQSDIIQQMFNEETIPALDNNCRADLQANGGK